MHAIDTNILVRCLIVDDEAQARRARDVVRSGPVFVSLTVLLEAEWVLRAAMEMPRLSVLAEIERFCGLPTVVLGSAATVSNAVEWAKAGLDFADALHLAQASGCETFVTFDRKLIKQAPSEGARVVSP